MEDSCLFGLIPLEVSFEGHVDVVLVRNESYGGCAGHLCDNKTFPIVVLPVFSFCFN